MVYTPRSDDPVLDGRNYGDGETRTYGADELVALAVFRDTDVDLSGHKDAIVVGGGFFGWFLRPGGLPCGFRLAVPQGSSSSGTAA
jgi:hypothetical protein